MNLIESADDQINLMRRWLNEAKEARELLEELPTEVKELTGSASLTMGVLSITVYKSTVEVIQALNRLGVVFSKAEVSYSNSWYTTGEVTLATGVKLKIVAYNIDAPLNCHIEEYKETVTRYRSVCEEAVDEG